MTGVYQRDAEVVGQAHADIAGVGVVAVDQIGNSGLFAQPVGQVVHETVEVIPQLFFADVLWGSGVDADDPCLVRQRFDWNGVVVADGGVRHAAGHQIDAFHVWTRGQCPGQIDDVFGLSPSIGVTTQLQVLAADKPVNAEKK